MIFSIKKANFAKRQIPTDMLQFITNNNISLPVAEQVRAAIEGGCGWIQLSIDGLDEQEQKKLAEEIIPLCQPSDAFMTIEHNVSLVEDLKVHGVHLFPGDMLPREVRQTLGAHAVIGVTVTSAEEVISLRSADIDYVQIGPYPSVSLEHYAAIIDKLEENGVKTPVVATGDIKPEDVRAILATGVKGVGIVVPDASAESVRIKTQEYLSA